jgi:hypothetical protein
MVAPAIINAKDGGMNYDMDAPLPAPTDQSLTGNAALTAATAAVVNIAAAAQPIYIRRMIYGFKGGTPASSLQIESPVGTIVWGPIPVGQPFMNFINLGWVFPANQAVRVTLSNPGGAVIGALQVDADLMQ